jgi:hypothetical protein
MIVLIFNKWKVFTLLNIYIGILSGQLLFADSTTLNQPKSETDTSKKHKIKNSGKKVKLTITGTGTSTIAGGLDRSKNHTTCTFTLPKNEGKLTIKCHYTMHGSAMGGYTLSGPSYQYGYIKNNEFVITAAENFFRGESMKRTKVKPHVHIPLKNGAKVTYDFHRSTSKAHCDCTATYMLKFKVK